MSRSISAFVKANQSGAHFVILAPSANLRRVLLRGTRLARINRVKTKIMPVFLFTAALITLSNLVNL